MPKVSAISAGEGTITESFGLISVRPLVGHAKSKGFCPLSPRALSLTEERSCVQRPVRDNAPVLTAGVRVRQVAPLRVSLTSDAVVARGRASHRRLKAGVARMRSAFPWR